MQLFCCTTYNKVVNVARSHTKSISGVRTFTYRLYYPKTNVKKTIPPLTETGGGCYTQATENIGKKVFTSLGIPGMLGVQPHFRRLVDPTFRGLFFSLFSSIFLLFQNRIFGQWLPAISSILGIFLSRFFSLTRTHVHLPKRQTAKRIRLMARDYFVRYGFRLYRLSTGLRGLILSMTFR